MPLFKKNKKKKATATTATRKKAPPPPPTTTQQTTKQVTKFVGDEKHVTTITYDEKGTSTTKTTIMKLTVAERQQLGMNVNSPFSSSQSNLLLKKAPPSSSSKPTPPTTITNTNTTSSRTMDGTNTSQLSSNASTSVTNITFGDETLATIEITRELVKKFISDIWNRGEIELIPSICHPSLRFNGHVGMDRVGHEGFARMVSTVREALMDYHCEIHSMVVESNKAFCRLRFTGKHTGNLLGYAPTGKTVSWMGASEFTCKNGKILKVWELGDVKSLEEQLRS